MRILFTLLMAARAGAMLPGMPVPPPAGMRVYVRLTAPQGTSTSSFMGQQARGDSFSFTSPSAMALTALRVRIKKAGSRDGNGDAWECADGDQSLQVSLPAGAGAGTARSSAGSLQVQAGDTVTCSYAGTAKTRPFADIVLLGN